MDPASLSLIIALVSLIVLLAAGINIGICLGLSGILGTYFLLGNWTAGINMLFIQTFDISSSYTLMVIPLFILLGTIATQCGLTNDLFTMFYRWCGRVSGGIALATIGTCAGMAAITGSSVATSAAMSRIALPQLRRYGYQERLSVGAIAVGGTLSIMIPPSITLVLYAVFAEQSVGKMLVAGILPGIGLALLYALVVYVRCRLNPALGPAGPRFSMRERVEVTVKVLPFLVVIAAVVLGILLGIWTPVESAGVAAVLVTVLAFMRREFTWRALFVAAQESVMLSASVFVVVIGSMVFSSFLALNGFSDLITSAIIGMQLPPFVLFLVLVGIYLVLGMFMEVSSLLALTIPLVLPIVIATGWNPIWFGVIVVSLMEVAAVTPPVGLNLYAVKGSVPDVKLADICIGSLQFWLMNIVIIFILYWFPSIALFLPETQ